MQSREFLDYTRVIKYGACNISDPNATKTSQNQPKNTQKPSDITYLLLTDSFVFFTKTHHENKVNPSGRTVPVPLRTVYWTARNNFILDYL